LDDTETKIFTSEPSVFLSIIDSIEQYYYNNFNEFFRKNTDNMDDWFVKKNTAEIRYYFDRRKLWYPVRYRRYTGKDPHIGTEYFNNIAKDSFNDPDLLGSEVFLQYLSTYLNIQSAGNYKTTDYMMYPIKTAGTSRYQAIIDLKAHQQITDYLLTNQLKSIIWLWNQQCGKSTNQI
jgi:ABC-type antimicrobial peptide transport system permease subunit